MGEYEVLKRWLFMQLIFLRKSDCLGCAVLLCLGFLLDLACFFLPSFSSLIKTCTCKCKCSTLVSDGVSHYVGIGIDLGSCIHHIELLAMLVGLEEGGVQSGRNSDIIHMYMYISHVYTCTCTCTS